MDCACPTIGFPVSKVPVPKIPWLPKVLTHLPHTYSTVRKVPVRRNFPEGSLGLRPSLFSLFRRRLVPCREGEMAPTQAILFREPLEREPKTFIAPPVSANSALSRFSLDQT